MADINRIKANIEKMISGGATETEIDRYVSSEGVTVEQLKAAPPASRQPLAKGDALGPTADKRTDFAPRPPSGLESGARGAFDTGFMGWGDEAAAALAVKPFDGNWGGQYQQSLDRIRQQQQTAQDANPVEFGVGQVAGAVAPMAIPGLNVARGATTGARLGYSALQGAGYGAAYGSGSSDGTAVDRIGSTFPSAAFGAFGGMAGAGAVEGVTAGTRAVVNRLAPPFRAAVAPSKEAARRVGAAMAADNAITQPRLTAKDELAAFYNRQPVLNVDRGGETTRAPARSAANTSPEARAALTNATDERFAMQGDRTVDVVHQIVGGGTTADNRAQLIQAARTANRPAYKAAYAAGDKPIVSPELERLMGSPDVVQAMKAATKTGSSRAIVDGYGVFKPGVTVTDDGQVIFRKGLDGGPTYPNLQFWDYTHRALRDAADAAARAGKNDEASYLGSLSKTLRDELDKLVPEFGTARSGAASFFGAQDALEAGDKFLRSRMGNDEARAALAKMSTPERKLFAEGYADALVRSIREVGDRRNVINSTFLNSAASRERMELALGPQKARELESFLRIEEYLDKARKAVSGNSTTARQLAELGLAGTVGAVATGGNVFDPKFYITAALVRGGRAGFRAIDARVAQKVGELLASPDPTKIQQGLAMVANNAQLFNAVRSIAAVPATAAGSEAVVRQSRSVVFNDQRPVAAMR